MEIANNPINKIDVAVDTNKSRAVNTESRLPIGPIPVVQSPERNFIISTATFLTNLPQSILKLERFNVISLKQPTISFNSEILPNSRPLDVVRFIANIAHRWSLSRGSIHPLLQLWQFFSKDTTYINVLKEILFLACLLHSKPDTDNELPRCDENGCSILNRILNTNSEIFADPKAQELLTNVLNLVKNIHRSVPFLLPQQIAVKDPELSKALKIAEEQLLLGYLKANLTAIGKVYLSGPSKGVFAKESLYGFMRFLRSTNRHLVMEENFPLTMSVMKYVFKNMDSQDDTGRDLICHIYQELKSADEYKKFPDIIFLREYLISLCTNDKWVCVSSSETNIHISYIDLINHAGDWLFLSNKTLYDHILEFPNGLNHDALLSLLGAILDELQSNHAIPQSFQASIDLDFPKALSRLVNATPDTILKAITKLLSHWNKTKVSFLNQHPLAVLWLSCTRVTNNIELIKQIFHLLQHFRSHSTYVGQGAGLTMIPLYRLPLYHLPDHLLDSTEIVELVSKLFHGEPRPAFYQH